MQKLFVALSSFVFLFSLSANALDKTEELIKKHPELQNIQDEKVKNAVIEIMLKQEKGVVREDVSNENIKDESAIESLTKNLKAKVATMKDSYQKWRRGDEFNYEAIAGRIRRDTNLSQAERDFGVAFVYNLQTRTGLPKGFKIKSSELDNLEDDIRSATEHRFIHKNLSVLKDSIVRNAVGMIILAPLLLRYGATSVPEIAIEGGVAASNGFEAAFKLPFKLIYHSSVGDYYENKAIKRIKKLKSEDSKK